LAGKYLNFGKGNTGIVVTPAAGGAPTSLTAWAANDSSERDPASFWLGGTNGDSLTGDYTFIASGLLALPETRNGGGAAELLESNSATASFTNSATFTNYLVVFPTLKNGGAANSMQVADVQIFDAANNGIFASTDGIFGVQVEGVLVPEPSTGLLALIGLAGFLRRRR
jgi:MprA protease rhombosortase-interaction domain-containing protein